MNPMRARKSVLRRLRVSRDCPRGVLRDLAMEHSYTGGGVMFDGLQRGMVICVVALDFPYVGVVDDFGDSFVRLRGAVKVLWDGRHGEFAAGKPPASAEIEQAFPLFTISADAIIGWGPYPGDKIPRAQ